MKFKLRTQNGQKIKNNNSKRKESKPLLLKQTFLHFFKWRSVPKTKSLDLLEYMYST